MSKRKFFDSGEEWQKFREVQAARFGMAPTIFATFFKTYPFSVRDCDYEHVYGIVLTGKSEIAAFLGITVTTLKAWRNNPRYQNLPVDRGLPESRTTTDCLLCWKARKEANAISEGLKRSAIASIMGESREYLRNNYLPSTEKRVHYKKRYSTNEIEKAIFLMDSRRWHNIECPLKTCTSLLVEK